MRRVVHGIFWVAQVPATLTIVAGLVLVATGRWALQREAELRR